MKTTIGFVVALLICAMALSGTLGCNTFRGVGKDIQRGGEAIENAAEKAQSKNEYREDHPHTITPTAALGGSISPSGSTSVPLGSSQTFITTADASYRIADVRVDGKSVGPMAYLYHDDSSSYAFSRVEANHVIAASFAVDTSR